MKNEWSTEKESLRMNNRKKTDQTYNELTVCLIEGNLKSFRLVCI